MSENDALCTVCQQQKNELSPSKSKLLPNLTLLRCNECVRGQKEPRFAVMMAAATKGNLAVEFWIKGHRYVGEEIKLSDIM